ncbi:MAG TPA: hypothetical protein VKP11_02085, partial [Frankiaceae bacterium]|nr:hypothetical protein [Frankiaceae bacterium]
WNDALYISTREFAGGTSFVGVGAYAVNKAQMVAGNPAPTVIAFLAGPSPAYNVGDGLLPADVDGPVGPPTGDPEIFLGSMDNGAGYGAPQDALTVWRFHADFVTPANSTFTLAATVPIAAFDTIPAFCAGRACVPQPGTTNKIDHLGYRQRPLHRAAYRNFGSHEAIVTNQSVEASATMSGIRWWELRDPNGTPTIFQEGTYAPGTTDSIHRWMGSIALDSAGNMALGYSASAATGTFPSVWYTGRLIGDPAGTMPQGEGSVIDGTGSQTGGGNRWATTPRPPSTRSTTARSGWSTSTCRRPAPRVGGCASAPSSSTSAARPTSTSAPRRRARRSAPARTPSTRSTSARSRASPTTSRSPPPATPAAPRPSSCPTR